MAMAKLKSKTASDAADSSAGGRNREDEGLPPDVAEVKAKLEAQTGKKYKRREDIPSISHMLVHGAPGDKDRPRTWMELVGYPLILCLLFIGSLHLFLKYVEPPDRKFTLPTMDRQRQQAFNQHHQHDQHHHQHHQEARGLHQHEQDMTNDAEPAKPQQEEL